MNFPNSGFDVVIQQINKKGSAEIPKREPLNKDESSAINKGFREYSHYLVDLIDEKGRD